MSKWYPFPVCARMHIVHVLGVDTCERKKEKKEKKEEEKKTVLSYKVHDPPAFGGFWVCEAGIVARHDDSRRVHHVRRRPVWDLTESTSRQQRNGTEYTANSVQPKSCGCWELLSTTLGGYCHVGCAFTLRRVGKLRRTRMCSYEDLRVLRTKVLRQDRAHTQQL